MLFDALGTLDARESGVSVDLGPPQRRAVLGVLLVSANRPVHTDRLIDAVWDGNPSPNAAGAVHVHISRLRRVLGTDHLVRKSPGYMLCAVEEDLTVSVFERLAEQGCNALAAGEVERASCVLGEALGLWRGEAYEDFVYADWSRPERARLEELRLVVHEAHIDANLDLGNHAAVLPELELLAESHPTHERFCAQHMVALYRAQRMVDALDVFRRYRAVLRDELGLDPTPHLQELERRILDHDVTLLWPGRGDHTEVPVLNGDRFGTRPATGQPRRGLPSPLTTFVGRTTEISTVSDLVANHRLVTIVGPGGSGKSRLALEVAKRSASPDGNFWADLSSTRGATDIVATIWTSLGFTRPPTTDGTRALAHALEHRELLVVLDCCEPVADLAADVVCSIVESCSQVRVLCTSRQPLHVTGERVWRIPLLELPVAEELTTRDIGTNDALALFADRASAADGAFQLTPQNLATVSRICEAVDGLPLGIEIAAAHVAETSPSELLARFQNRFASIDTRLRGLPDRHRSLTNTIRWSYDMLEPAEQLLFERLSLLESPIRTTDVAVMKLVTVDASQALGALADKSLLARIRDGDQTDYRMLDTVRAFAAVQLERRDDRTVLTETVARHYAGIAAAGQTHLVDELAWINSMRKCERNIEGATSWCVDNDVDLGAEAFMGAYFYARWIAFSWPAMESAARVIAGSTNLAETTRLRLRAHLLSLQAGRPRSSDGLSLARSIAAHPSAPPDAIKEAQDAILRFALIGLGDVRTACEEYLASLTQIGMTESYRRHHLNYILSWIDGDVRSAHHHAVSTLETDDEPGNLCRRASHLRDIADTLLFLDERHSALDIAKKALETADSIGANAQRSLVLDEMSTIYLSSNDLHESLQCAIEATASAYDSLYVEGEIEGLISVALVCDRLGAQSLVTAAYRAARQVMDRYGAHPSFLHLKSDDVDRLRSDAGSADVDLDVSIPELLAKASLLLTAASTSR